MRELEDLEDERSQIAEEAYGAKEMELEGLSVCLSVRLSVCLSVCLSESV